MYHVYVPNISYSLPLRWYLGYLSVWMLAVDKRLCLLRRVHYICVVQRETKRESSPPTFRLGFLLVTPLARERRRSFEITYLGVKVHRPLSPPDFEKSPFASHKGAFFDIKILSGDGTQNCWIIA